MTCLAAICLTQAWMMWKFINFQLKKWREHSQNQASKKKTVSPKSKPHKREPTRGEHTHMTFTTLIVDRILLSSVSFNFSCQEVLPMELSSLTIKRHHVREKPKLHEGERVWGFWQCDITSLHNIQFLSAPLSKQKFKRTKKPYITVPLGVGAPFWNNSVLLSVRSVHYSFRFAADGMLEGQCWFWCFNRMDLAL